jgi:AraC-like DNA-binding protein
LIYRERLPTPLLRDFVERLWWLEGGGDEIGAEPIPPDGHPEIVVHGGDPFRESGGSLQERALIAGQSTRATRVSPSGAVRVVGARLRPDAAHALFGAPQHELTNRVVDLRDLDAPLASALRGDVAARSRGEEMLEGLEGALAAAVSRIPRRRRRDRFGRPAAEAIRLADRRGGLVRVEALARRLGVTRRQLERLFRDRVGIPPKLFLRILRFQRALGSSGDARAGGWAQVAVALGFYDQSHLIRDFRELAGRAPGEWSPGDASLAAVFSAVRRDAGGPSAEDVAFFQDASEARA